MKKIFPLMLLSFSVLAANPEMDVIYGDDNRMDVYESPDALLVEASRSTVAMIDTQNLRLTPSGYQIIGMTLKDRGACSKERFAHQFSVAKCSGFLAAPNVIVTAGHCAKANTTCPTGKWVFDYKSASENKNSVIIPRSSVYSCKRILSRALDPVSKQDYTVIELDRAVTDRGPLPFRKTGSVNPGDSVAVIGHPVGLPTKISDHAAVRRVTPVYFVANLDTYHGNSGSAVINTSTGVVEGILVRGDNDFVKDRSGCQVSKVCPDDGCRGEDVTNITIIDYLKNF
jgi:hypothetical protein